MGRAGIHSLGVLRCSVQAVGWGDHPQLREELLYLCWNGKRGYRGSCRRESKLNPPTLHGHQWNNTVKRLIAFLGFFKLKCLCVCSGYSTCVGSLVSMTQFMSPCWMGQNPQLLLSSCRIQPTGEVGAARAKSNPERMQWFLSLHPQIFSGSCLKSTILR